ncbi:hypothetical protein Tco_1369728 [Tanacetum coccineum]
MAPPLLEKMYAYERMLLTVFCRRKFTEMKDLVPNTVAPQTRSNPAVTDEILAGLRDPVAQMMREEMEKLTDEMRANAMEAITSTLVINQGDQRQTIQFTRAPRLSFQNLVVRMLTGGCTSFMRLIGDILPWLVFRGAIMQRFGNPIDDPLAELKICKFETSVEDYQNAYDKLLSRIQRISLTGFPAQSVGSSNTDVLDSPCLLVLITGTSQSRQHVITSLIHIESCKSPTKSLFDVGSSRISIFTVNT